MYFKNVDEKSAADFAEIILDHYSSIDNGSTNYIYTSNDEESTRNNVGWYNHEDGIHKVHINIPNILEAKKQINKGILDNDSFYAFLTLIVGHEFRHFRQGRCIFDDWEIDGYNQNDTFNDELMMYIRTFFDGYYLLNKGYVKYELDAEKFAVEKGLEFLRKNFPEMDSEKAMTAAVNFFANIQSSGFVASTLPTNNKNSQQIIDRLSEKLEINFRVPNLYNTLFVYNPRFYMNHLTYGLDERKVLTPDLILDYKNTEDGTARDLLVAERILSVLEKPNESLEDLPKMKQKYFKA